MAISELQLAFAVPGPAELLIILGIVVVLFGGSKLPLLGKSLGEGINNFKKSFKDEEENVQVAEVTAEKTSPSLEEEQKDSLEDQSQKEN